MAEAPLRLVLVLGLPQAGEGRLRRCLELCGAPAVEDRQLERLHAHSLEAAGTDELSIKALPERWYGSEVALAMREQIAETLRTVLPEAGLRVLQLPGQERMLPLWTQSLETLQLASSYVLVLRHPLEVAESLARTHKCTRDRGLLIWLQSMLTMEASTRGKQRFILEQERLNWDPEGVLDQLEQAFQLQLPERSHERLVVWEKEQQAGRAEALIAETPLAPASVEGSPLLQMALQLHSWLLAEARGESKPRLMPEVICEQLAWAEALFGRTLAEEQWQRRDAELKLQELSRSRLVRLRRWLHRQPPLAG